MDRDELEDTTREQLHKIRFYENWRVSAAVGVIVGVALTLALQAIF